MGDIQRARIDKRPFQVEVCPTFDDGEAAGTCTGRRTRQRSAVVVAAARADDHHHPNSGTDQLSFLG